MKGEITQDVAEAIIRKIEDRRIEEEVVDPIYSVLVNEPFYLKHHEIDALSMPEILFDYIIPSKKRAEQLSKLA